MYSTDCGLDLLACSLMTMLFLYWSRRSKSLEEAVAAV
jgi:hypothetical protein